MKILGFIGILIILISFTLYLIERSHFKSWVQSGQEAIGSDSLPNKRLSVESLPPLLSDYLKKVLVQAPNGSFVIFTQSGYFRMKPEDKMVSFSAEQYVSLASPMFSWLAKLPFKGLSVTVCDRLIKQEGELQARLFSAITVAKGSGKNFLRGELLRYLAEIPWFPMAILYQPNIQWKQVSEDSVIGSLSVHDVIASVKYQFGHDGLIKSIYVPDREMINGDLVDLRPWLGEFSEYGERCGLIIPNRGKVSWILETGKFTYFDGKIDSYQIGNKVDH
jgi:hypothetical protein